LNCYKKWLKAAACKNWEAGWFSQGFLHRDRAIQVFLLMMIIAVVVVMVIACLLASFDAFYVLY
jgi:type IV secretory pathway component VirB8